MVYRIEEDYYYKGLYYGKFLLSFDKKISFFQIGDLYIALMGVELKEGDSVELSSEKTIISGRLIKRKKTIKATTVYKYVPLSDTQILNGSFNIYILVD